MPCKELIRNGKVAGKKKKTRKIKKEGEEKVGGEEMNGPGRGEEVGFSNNQLYHKIKITYSLSKI